MKHLLIIGARGFGREIYCLATCSIGYKTEFDIKGFLDDDSTALDRYEGYPPIIDSVEDYEPKNEDVFICALGDIYFKKKYSEIILKKGGVFINLIDKDALISKNVKLGIGCIISREVLLSCDVNVGNFVTFQRAITIGHDVTIGNFCHFNANCFVGGFCNIGSNVTLWTSSIILPRITLENNCTIGAAAVVIKKVKEGTTVYGNPAKVLKY